MTKYMITFKKSKNSKFLCGWERFANSIEEATIGAREALNKEYSGKAVLVSVEENKTDWMREFMQEQIDNMSANDYAEFRSLID